MRAAVVFAIVGLLAGCGGGHSRQPSPSSSPAMDSAMTAIHDSGGTADSTASDTTRH